jgi:hypothetical protein
MFGKVDFRKSGFYKIHGGGGGSEIPARSRVKQLPGCEEADDVDIRQWMTVTSDIKYTPIMTSCPLYCRRKVVKMTRMKVIQTKLQRK